MQEVDNILLSDDHADFGCSEMAPFLARHREPRVVEDLWPGRYVIADMRVDTGFSPRGVVHIKLSVVFTACLRIMSFTASLSHG